VESTLKAVNKLGSSGVPARPDAGATAAENLWRDSDGADHGAITSGGIWLANILVDGLDIPFALGPPMGKAEKASAAAEVDAGAHKKGDGATDGFKNGK
jgi:hypothetical protein